MAWDTENAWRPDWHGRWRSHKPGQALVEQNVARPLLRVRNTGTTERLRLDCERRFDHRQSGKIKHTYFRDRTLAAALQQARRVDGDHLAGDRHPPRDRQVDVIAHLAKVTAAAAASKKPLSDALCAASSNLTVTLLAGSFTAAPFAAPAPPRRTSRTRPPRPSARCCRHCPGPRPPAPSPPGSCSPWP